MQPYCQKGSTQTNNPLVPIQKKDLTHDENLKYYEEYKKILETSFVLHQQIEGLKTLSHTLNQTVTEISANTQQFETNIEYNNKQKNNHQQLSENTNKPKRVRRTNNMIKKEHKCPAEKCEKIYASEGSLQQHIKIKHSGLYLADNAEEEKQI